MTALEALICGFVQGAAEFLPISSSGHLALFHAFFGGDGAVQGNLAFDILLHLATLFAIIIVYFKNIISLIPAAFSLLKKIFTGRCAHRFLSEREREVLLLFFGTIPLLAAFFIKDTVESVALYPKIVGALLVFNSVILLLGDSAKGKACLSSLTPTKAAAVGIFQLLAVFPGLSRSGSTIAGGTFMGLSRTEAVRFSFLLSVPAVIGANISNISALGDVPREAVSVYALGMAAAFISGLAAIKLLIFISEKSNFRVFACYCAVVGACAMIFS